MLIHHKILAYASPFLNAVRKIAVRTGFVSKNRLRVLIFHDIPPSEEKAFARQLNWLKKDWKIISPMEFEKLISGDAPVSGDNLMITFDDGFSSNRGVAERILNPMGIQALFFVVSDFVNIDNYLEARKFIANNISPEIETTDLPKDWGNMKWHDLEALIEQGHTIGCHTTKHLCLSDCHTDEELESEIILSADHLMEKLGVNIDHFAYSFGGINSFSKEALIIAKRKFRYIYSGIRGDNVKGGSPFSIRRDAASYQRFDNDYALFNNRLLDAFLGGAADFYYAKPRETIDTWCQKNIHA